MARPFKADAAGYNAKEMRLTEDEIGRLDLIAKNAGASRSATLAGLVDDFLDGRAAAEPYVTRRVTFVIDRERAEAAEQKAKSLGTTLRDVIRRILAD